MKFRIMLPFLALLVLVSCRKEQEVINKTIHDNVIYNIDGEVIYQSNTEKNKQKTSSQYLSILYANLFQQAIPQDDLLDLSEVRQAIGDKAVADELVLNSYVNAPTVIIPTNAEMRNDIDAFVEATYRRFFLRKPSAYEKHFLKKTILDDPDLTPEVIYSSFALSNEYKYY